MISGLEVDGWVKLDGAEEEYVLIDATPLGLEKLLEKIDTVPPT